MAHNFPNNPVIGDASEVNDKVYKWDGIRWVSTNKAVRSVTRESISTDINLNLANYHKISLNGVFTEKTIFFSNIPSGSSKWYVELKINDLSGFSFKDISYDNKSLLISEDTVPRSLSFGLDGLKLYVLGATTRFIYQYTLETPWEINTGSYDGVAFNVTAIDTLSRGIEFKPDGSVLYIVGDTNNRIFQLPLSTPWDISTAIYGNAFFTVGTQESNPNGVTFKPDGTKMFVIGITADRVFQYTLAAPWDITTAVYDNISFSVLSQGTNSTGIKFNSDGTHMYVLDGSLDTVFEYSLSTPWDLTSLSYNGINFSVTAQEATPFGFALKNDESKLYLVGSTNDTIYQYTKPQKIIWNNKTEPILEVGNTVIIEFYTPDGGKTIYGIEQINTTT